MDKSFYQEKVKEIFCQITKIKKELPKTCWNVKVK